VTTLAVEFEVQTRSRPVRAPARRARRGRHAAAVALLAAATLASHGWSLRDGLALDDHWHYRRVQECPWSISGLLGATTIDVSELVDVWWQGEPVRFVYARPVAVALLKATYAVTGGSPTAAHAVSLLLHIACGALVYVLGLRLTRRWWAAVAGGLAFVLFPQSVFAVGWLAAQNALLATLFMLAGLLAYLRASSLAPDSPAVRPPPVRIGWLAVTAGCWLAALFSRENAVMLPAIFIAADAGWGGRRWLRSRAGVHAAFVATAVGYLLWRVLFFSEAMPDVYVGRPNGDVLGYVSWCVAKLTHYASSVLWPAPLTVGPTGRYAPWTERPADTWATVAIVGLIVSLYALQAHGRRGWWIWPLWVLLAVLPVTAVLATPHAGYLAAPGVALGMAISLAGAKRSRGRQVGRVAAALLVLATYAASNKAARLMWRGLEYAEAYTQRDVLADPPGPQVTDVFCLNLPFAAIYTPLVAQQAHPQARAARWHVLSFAPHLARMEERCRITRVAANALDVEIGPQPYFGGLLGRFLLRGFGHPRLPAEGDRVDGDGYQVEVIGSGPDGVHRLRYTFAEPLDSPRYCFYLSSFTCGALRLRFDRPVRTAGAAALEPPASVAQVHEATERALAGDALAGERVIAGLASSSPPVREAAVAGVQLVAVPMADALAAPLPRLTGAGEDAAALTAWWREHVDDRALAFVFREREERWDIRHRRDELKRGRALAAQWLRTDLYFSGPPFPGPR
jgi:hypothetical protein